MIPVTFTYQVTSDIIDFTDLDPNLNYFELLSSEGKEDLSRLQILKTNSENTNF